MRTTLNIDDDVLNWAKALALHENRSLSDVVTDVLREKLERPRFVGKRREGILLLPDRPGPMVTTEMVNALRDDDEF